jgi:hypothetical protein
VGLDWQFAGIGPIHAAGASDLVLRNVNTGQFEVYDADQQSRTGSPAGKERGGAAHAERDFYFKKASALEQENRELTDSATKYSVHAQKSERELTQTATQYSQRAQKLERSTPYGVKSWNANSIELIPMVRLDAGSMHKTNNSHPRRGADLPLALPPGAPWGSG